MQTRFMFIIAHRQRIEKREVVAPLQQSRTPSRPQPINSIGAALIFTCCISATLFESRSESVPSFQSSSVKIAVDSGICPAPTELSICKQTLPCNICPTSEPTLTNCNTSAGKEKSCPLGSAQTKRPASK